MPYRTDILTIDGVRNRVRYNDDKFTIEGGYDHFNCVKLYRVVGVNNEYAGEWGRSLEDVESELAGLESSVYKHFDCYPSLADIAQREKNKK